MKSVNELINLLGENNVVKLKKDVSDVITNRIKDDLEDYDMYLIAPEEIQEIVDEVVEEVKIEIKEIIKEKLLAEAMCKISSL